jgi:hypothetical protein
MEDAAGVVEVARRLAAILSAPGSAPLSVRPLAPLPPPARVAAVDGSSAILAESGSHLVGALRVAGVAAGRVERRGLEVHLLEEQDPSGLAAGERLGALRAGAEHALAARLLAELGRGDLLLLDGSLRAAPALDGLLERAGDRGVDVVGVCKSTSLTVSGVPALAACSLAARDAGAGAWIVELPAPPNVRGRVLVARLARAEDRPFRFDVASSQPERALARVASLAGHPAAPGYPSPLAMAHQAATILEEERRRLALDVMERVAAMGVRGEAWRAAFFDYHEVLELGA